MTLSLNQFFQLDIIIKFVLTFIIPLALTITATYFAAKKKQVSLAIFSFGSCFSFVNLMSVLNFRFFSDIPSYFGKIYKYVIFKQDITADDYAYNGGKVLISAIESIDKKGEGILYESLVKSLEKVGIGLENVSVSLGTAVSEILSGCVFNLFAILVFALCIYLIKAND